MNNIYRGTYYQRGYGLGNTFRRFFSWIVPIVKKHAMPAISEVGKRAIDTVSDIAKDVVSGKKLKDSAEERINRSVDELKTYVDNKLEGKGIKKRKKKNNKFSDFFNKK